MDPAQESRRVDQECRDFLYEQAPTLDPSKVHTHINPGDQWHPLGPKSIVDLPGIIELTMHLENALHAVSSLVSFPPASVEIIYDMPAPLLLSAIPGFPPSIPLRGYCVCYR
jgi:hypothetical protein